MKKIVSFIGCIFFTTIVAQAQVRVAAPINPSSPNDVYATHIDTLGQGGFMVVANKLIRNNIPPLRRKKGMLVYVRETDSVYQLNTNSIIIPLTDTDWDKFKLGSVGGLIWWGSLAAAPSGTPALNWAYFNNVDKKTYVYSMDGPLGVPAWNAITASTLDGLPEIIPDNRTFTGGTISYTGGIPVGGENIVVKSSIKPNIDPNEYKHTQNGEFIPRYRRYVLGLSNDGKIELVRTNVTITMVIGENSLSSNTTVNPGSAYYFDIKLDNVFPSLITNGQEVPTWYFTHEIVAGPLINVVHNYTGSYLPPLVPSNSQLEFPPLGIVITASSPFFGEMLEGEYRDQIFVRVRLENVTAAPIILPKGLKLRATVWGADRGETPSYNSEIPPNTGG